MDLKGTCLRYSDEITEEVFDRIVEKIYSLGYTKTGSGADYKGFVTYENLLIGFISHAWCTAPSTEGQRIITVSDIIGSDWNKKQNVVLVDGEIYNFLWDNGSEFIAKITNDKKGCHNISCYSRYYMGGDFSEYTSCAKRIRPATPEEKQWLNCCIEAGKFVSKEEALSSKGKLTDDWHKSLKKGDCVVAVNEYKPYYIKDCVYEVGKVNHCIDTTIDSAGNKLNGWGVLNFRPATQQEKELYLLFGKPVHINTPLPKDNSSTASKQALNANRCVHVTTKQQWDFVSEKLGYGEYTGRYFNDGFRYVRLNKQNAYKYHPDGDYQILSFDEWLEETDNGCDWLTFYNKACREGKAVHHIDGDRINNKIENLVWCEPKGNSFAFERSMKDYVAMFEHWRYPTKDDLKEFEQLTTKKDIVLLGEFEPVRVSEYKEPNINF